VNRGTATCHQNNLYAGVLSAGLGASYLGDAGGDRDRPSPILGSSVGTGAAFLFVEFVESRYGLGRIVTKSR